MFGLSFTHLIVLLVLALIFIGPEQLPEVARTIGRLLNEFKRATNVLAEDMKSATRDENIRKLSSEVEAHNAKVAENHPTTPESSAAPIATSSTTSNVTSNLTDAKDSNEPKKG